MVGAAKNLPFLDKSHQFFSNSNFLAGSVSVVKITFE